MKTVALYNLGRFGNRCFRFCYTKSLCEQNNYELRTEPWEGESIFTLDGHIPKRPDGTEDIVIDGYHQSQESLIYSRADCRRWFEIKPEVETRLEFSAPPVDDLAVAHLRRGDYKNSSYPLVSANSVYSARRIFGLRSPIMFVTDDKPPGEDNDEEAMVRDFYYMVRANILFRANSSFSYWAGVLSHGRVFSPIITGLAGGVEHDNVPYIEGNHPRLCELDFVTDLHLRET